MSRVEWVPTHPEGLVWCAVIHGTEYTVLADGVDVPEGYTCVSSRPRTPMSYVAADALRMEGML